MKQIQKHFTQILENAFPICLFAAAWLIFCLTTTSMAAGPQYGGILQINMTQPMSLDPHIESYESTTIVTNNVYNQLLTFAKDGLTTELDLAESWKRMDDTTYVFKIRKGIHFQNIPPVNGRELTSADVKYSIERVMGMYGRKPDFKHRFYFEDKLASIETPDKYTIIFKTKEPYAAFITYIASPFCAIVPKEAVEKFGDLKRQGIGTGPFILKEYESGAHTILEKNPNYFKKGLPYLDAIHIRIMRDDASVLAAFLAGKLDMIYFVFEYQIDNYKKEAPDANIIPFLPQYYRQLTFQPWIEGKPLDPPFNDVRVRRAIGMAIDKQKLVDLTEGGKGKPMVGPIPNMPPYSLPEADQIEYNPNKAKKLLAEAGYPNGFSTELFTWNEGYMVRPAQVIVEMLKEIGIEAELKILEMAQFWSRMYKFEYKFAFPGGGAAVEPEEYLVHYFGKHATAFRWSNPEIWRLVEEQSRILDKEKRIAKIHEVQRKIMEDCPRIFLFTPSFYRVFKPYVYPKEIYKNNYQFPFEKVWIEKH